MRKSLTFALVLLCLEILQVLPLCAQAGCRFDAVVLQGQSAPGTGGGVFSNFRFAGTTTSTAFTSPVLRTVLQPPWINGLGDVLFVAGISGGTTPGGLFLSRAGSIIPIALAGQPAPETQKRFNRISPIRFNDRGDVAFYALRCASTWLSIQI